MTTTIDVAIIGAGPYGLSLAAHLYEARIELRIFGKTMDSWKSRMPPGMHLKSHPWSSCLYDPRARFTLRQFSAEQGIAYHDSQIPVSLETFVAYGEAFQQRLVPHVEDRTLVNIDPTASGLRATFSDGETVLARRIILAVGVHPFKYLPESLGHLPAEALSHSGDHGPLTQFAGKEVLVIGSGASATDLAALLRDQGAAVSLLARARELPFPPAAAPSHSRLRHLASPLRPLFYPTSGIGATWLLKLCADWPGLIHALPRPYRLHLARTQLGPLGQAAARERIVGKLPLYLGRQVQQTQMRNGRVQLRLASVDGMDAETLHVDHIIAATGFAIDLRRLDFLRPLLPDIRTVDNAPVLSANYESSIPGLHFIGPATTASFGPVARFVFGAVHPARRLAQQLPHTLARRLNSGYATQGAAPAEFS